MLHNGWKSKNHCKLLCCLATDEDLQKVEVEYLTMPGWCTNTEEVRQFDDLPVQAKQYVRKVEELMGVPGLSYTHFLLRFIW